MYDCGEVPEKHFQSEKSVAFKGSIIFYHQGRGSWNWIEIHKNELFPPTNVTKISVPPFKKDENFMFLSPPPPPPLRLHFTALISVQPDIVKMKK